MIKGGNAMGESGQSSWARERAAASSLGQRSFIGIFLSEQLKIAGMR